MHATCKTLWHPLSATRVARIRIDVLEEVLPSRLEVEQASAPTELELEYVNRAMANGLCDDAPPFDVGLPPFPH